MCFFLFSKSLELLLSATLSRLNMEQLYIKVTKCLVLQGTNMSYMAYEVIHPVIFTDDIMFYSLSLYDSMYVGCLKNFLQMQQCDVSP